jgi:hypothetical protein
MKALVTTYNGDEYQAAIEEIRRRNPEHKGVLIVLPAGRTEQLLRVNQAESRYELTQQQNILNEIKLLN